MEGVGARLGRSSTRYVPATVFTGPVRKWKKKWVHAQPSSPNHHAAANRAVNAASHLLFYKWTPITSSLNNNNGINANGSYNCNADSKNSNRGETAVLEEPLKKKFKYIPIVVLEEQKNESSEAKPIEIDTTTIEASSKSDGCDEKPDVTIDESQAPETNPVEQRDLNESSLDLSLGSNGEDEADRVKANQLE